MKNRYNKNLCSHPKRKVAQYLDDNNTYIERCLVCTKTLYLRKFPKTGAKL